MKTAAFTLSELLIALAILALIATFTIPKVLQSVSDNGDRAKFRETIALLYERFNTLRQEVPISGATNMTPFFRDGVNAV